MKIKDLFANFAKCKGNFKIFLISPSAHPFAKIDLEMKNPSFVKFVIKVACKRNSHFNSQRA